MRLVAVVPVILLAVAGLPARGVPAARYNIVALDVLPGGVDSYATSINELGIVVGHATLDRSGHVGQSRPMMWDSTGTPTELWDDPVFGGIPAGINSIGQVVGRYGSGSGIPLPGPGIPPGGAFIWDPATRSFMDLGDLGGRNVQATAINDAGQVSGSSETFDGQPRAFIWDAVNDMRPIGTLGGIWSFGNDINSSGQVTGYSWLSDFSEHAFLWSSQVGIADISGTPFSRATALNDLETVIGYANDEGSLSGPFIWSELDGMQPLALQSGSLDIPWDINNKGQIVGERTGDGRVHAVLWEDSLGAQDLENLISPSSGWLLEKATSINDRGQIIGHGLLNDQVRGFLLTPIPEPSSLAVAVMATILWLVFLARHRNVY